MIGVWGVLDIENASTLTMQWARFYAEYFDAAGRLCFTLVFATQANAHKLEKDARPDEQKTARPVRQIGRQSIRRRTALSLCFDEFPWLRYF